MLKRSSGPGTQRLLRRLWLLPLALMLSGQLQAQIPSVCDRTAGVRDAIVEAVSAASDCSQVTAEHLKAIDVLDFNGKGLTALKDGDLSGLTGVRWMTFIHNRLTTVPGGIFADMSSLLYLNLCFNQITHLPADAFAGLGNMAYLILHVNKLQSLPDGIFAGLPNLKILWLDENPGAPFDFVAQVEITGSNTGRVRMAKGAPFDISVRLTSNGGTVQPQQLTIRAGQTHGEQDFVFTGDPTISAQILTTSVPSGTVYEALAAGPKLPQPPPAGTGSPAYRSIQLFGAAPDTTVDDLSYVTSPDIAVAGLSNSTPDAIAWSRQALALADSMHMSIVRRLDRRDDGSAAAKGGTAFDPAHFLSTRAGGPMDGQALLRDLLTDRSFQIDNGNSEEEGDIRWSIWGHSNLIDVSDSSTEYGQSAFNGEVLDLQLGVDAFISPNLLIGGLVSMADGDFRYNLDADVSDSLQTFSPYLGWFQDRYRLWLALGSGSSQMQTRSYSCDRAIQSLQAGGSGGWTAGSLKLNLSGHITRMQVDTDANDSCQDSDINRAKFSADFSWPIDLASGARLSPTWQVGVRRDSGALDGGKDLVFGAGITYAGTNGLSFAGGTQLISADRGNYEEQSLHFSLGYQFAKSHHGGLTLGLHPSFSRVHGERAGDDPAAANGDGLLADVSYGLTIPGLTWLLQPYSSLTLAGEKPQRFSLGARYGPGTDWQISLDYSLQDRDEAVRESQIELAGYWRF